MVSHSSGLTGDLLTLDHTLEKPLGSLCLPEGLLAKGVGAGKLITDWIRGLFTSSNKADGRRRFLWLERAEQSRHSTERRHSHPRSHGRFLHRRLHPVRGRSKGEAD